MGRNHSKLLNNLEQIRKSCGLTQQELSMKAEVSRKSINAIENGVNVPSTVLALKISKTLNFIAKKKVYVFRKNKIKINNKKIYKFLKKKICLLHCVTDYPVSNEYANLIAIETLSKFLRSLAVDVKINLLYF